MKNKKAYILYQYDQFNNDYTQVMEYLTLKELQEKENIHLKNKKSIYNFVTTSIDEVKHLLQDKYIIIEEVI